VAPRYPACRCTCRSTGSVLLARDAGILGGEFQARLMLLGAFGGIGWVLILGHGTRDYDCVALSASLRLLRRFLSGRSDRGRIETGAAGAGAVGGSGFSSYTGVGASLPCCAQSARIRLQASLAALFTVLVALEPSRSPARLATWIWLLVRGVRASVSTRDLTSPCSRGGLVQGDGDAGAVLLQVLIYFHEIVVSVHVLFSSRPQFGKPASTPRWHVATLTSPP